MSGLLSQLDALRPLPPVPESPVEDPATALVLDRIAHHWLPQPVLSTEDWIRSHLRLTANQSAGNAGRPLDLARNPQSRIILDFLADPYARELNLEKGSAAGCTTTVIAAIIHRLRDDPCNILYLIGSKDEARKISQVYFRPYLTQVFGEDVVNDRRQALLHYKVAGVEVMLGSPTEDMMRGKQFGLLIEDESDTMEEELRGGSQNLDVAQKERTKNFAGAKIIRLCCPLYAYDSTLPKDVEQPMTRIDRHYQRGDRREFRLPCPACGNEHAVTRHDLHHDHCRDLTGAWDLDAIRTGTCWVCPSCQHRVRDTLAEKGPWFQRGRFVPTKKAITSTVWSAKITDLASLFGQAGSWGYVMSQIREAETEGPSKLAGVLRAHLAEPLQRSVENEGRTQEMILRHCAAYERGTCPIIPWFVGTAADVQHNASYFPWVSAAFTQRGDLFVIDWGEAQDTDELEEIYRRPIPCHLPDSLARARFGDKPVPPVHIQRAVIDSGHRAKNDEVDPTKMVVYKFCASTLMREGTVYRYRWTPLKGRSKNQLPKELVKTSQAKLNDTTIIPLVLFCDPDFKTELYHYQLPFDPRPGAPGEAKSQQHGALLPRIFFPRFLEVQTLEENVVPYAQFLRELTSERFGAVMERPTYGGDPVEVRKWYVPSGQRNNFGDCLKMLKVLHATIPQPAQSSAKSAW